VDRDITTGKNAKKSTLRSPITGYGIGALQQSSRQSVMPRRHAARCVEFYSDLAGLAKWSGTVDLLKSDSQLQIKRGGKCS
jgi:hypothetical protein